MHSYTLDNNCRDKVVKTILIVSIIISVVLTGLLGEFLVAIKNYLEQYDLVVKVLNLFDSLGVNTNFLGTPVIYGILYGMFNNYGWKWKVFSKWHKVPDLNGCWKGELHSITQNKKIDMSLKIIQTWNKIQFVSTFPNSKSTSQTASIFIEKDGMVHIGFGFINRSRELPHQYDGYNIVDIDDETHLFGRYMNNRDNSNKLEKHGNIGMFVLAKMQEN